MRGRVPGSEWVFLDNKTRSARTSPSVPMSSSYRSVAATATAALFALFFTAASAFSQNAPSAMMIPRDPGVRGGPAGAGGPLPGLGAKERYYFKAARARFEAVDSVSGTINDAPAGVLSGGGLGPRFNLNRRA